MGGNLPAGFAGMMLLPVLRNYQETKDAVAAELASKFSRLVIDLMPDFGGSAAVFQNPALGKYVAHVNHLSTLTALPPSPARKKSRYFLSGGAPPGRITPFRECPSKSILGLAA